MKSREIHFCIAGLAVIGCVAAIIYVTGCRKAHRLAPEMHDLLRGMDNVDTIALPESVTVFRPVGFLQMSTNGPNPWVFNQRSDVVVTLPSVVIGQVRSLLLDTKSYYTGEGVKPASFLPELVIAFQRKGHTLDVYICVASADILVKRDDGEEWFLDMSPALAALQKTLGPVVKLGPGNVQLTRVDSR